MKTCSNSYCSQDNPQSLDEFYKAKGCKDGRRNECKSCRITKQATYVESRKEETAAYQKKYQQENVEKLAKYHADYGTKYYENNKEKIDTYQLAYRNNNKQEVNERIANWAKNNKGKRNAITAKYRSAKLQATMDWLTEGQWREIRDLYEEADRISAETGIPHHVDHIEPLQGVDRSGLHVPWNLQILVGPGPDGNLAKGNRTR